ncbi:hypothetical protein [Rathayibacter sp. AY1E4]|uniref:hypothetical protein n=1 Tax=unclassified Rathayibacter TaxID=2609250 RepID=UPI0011B01D07|nr:hypothetical protein [Rathayibacter sp. AY1E4]
MTEEATDVGTGLRAATPAPDGSVNAFIGWTAAGVVTVVAALVLMFSSFMVALGVTDADPSEGAIAIGAGGVGAVIWIVVAAVGGYVAPRRLSRRPVLVAWLPAVVSALWCGIAIGLFPVLLENVVLPMSLTPVPMSQPLLFQAMILTAGAIPAGAGLLVINLVLRVIKARRGRVATHTRGDAPDVGSQRAS